MYWSPRGVLRPMLPMLPALFSAPWHRCASCGRTRRQHYTCAFQIEFCSYEWRSHTDIKLNVIFANVSRPRAAVTRLAIRILTIYPCGLCLPCARDKRAPATLTEIDEMCTFAFLMAIGAMMMMIAARLDRSSSVLRLVIFITHNYFCEAFRFDSIR